MTRRPNAWTGMVAVILVTFVAGSAIAGDTAPGRYQIVKATETTAWRMDTQTGEIVACRFSGTAMICGSTEDAVKRGKTSYQDYKSEKAAERKAAREEDLAFMEKVFELFKGFVSFFMEQERAADQTRTASAADCDCKCP